MKTQTIVTDITHDDLVNLLCTAAYGSHWIDIKTPKGNYKGTELEDDNDCREDKWAKVLLAGKTMYFCDYYAEGCYYGSLPHKDCRDVGNGYDYMRYEFTLEDIKNGLARALSSGTYISDYARHLMDDDSCDFDQPEAEALMQYIIFGEEIYG